VTVDCAALCLKSGNASILRAARRSSRPTGLGGPDLGIARRGPAPRDSVQLVPTTDRAALEVLLKLDSLIHCIILAGRGPYRFVAENSTIPVIKHYTGVCFVYLDRAAGTPWPRRSWSSKVQRPESAMREQLLVHKDCAARLLPGSVRP